MKLTRDEVHGLAQDPIELFYSGIKSPVTRAKYVEILKRVLCDTLEQFLQGSFEERAKQLVVEAKQNPDWATNILLAISKKLKERTQLPTNHKNYLNPNSVPNFFKPIKKLFDMNAVLMSWARIYASYPESNNNNEGRGYTRQEIQEMLKFAKGALDRAIIHVAASSGIREGAFSMQWQDLTPVYKINENLTFDITESEMETAVLVCAMLTIYKNTNDEYPTFITPEAYQSLLDYKMTWIKEAKRIPKETDPIFKNTGPSVRSLSPSGIRSRMYRVTKNAGVWNSAVEGKRRSETPIMNGFRRFWNKTCKESLSRDSPLGSLIKKEMMMGHTGLIKLDKNYFKAHPLELAEEYLSIVPNLTISDEQRIKEENKKLRREKSEIEQKNQQLEESLKKVDELWADKERMELAEKQKSLIK